MATETISQLRQNSVGATDSLRNQTNIAGSSLTNTVGERQELQPQDNTQSLLGQNDLDRTVEELSSLVQGFNRELNFSVDDASGRTIIKVIDSETDEVIRQIPSEEVVELAQAIDQHAGLLIDANV